MITTCTKPSKSQTAIEASDAVALQKFQTFEKELNAGLIGRGDEVRIVLIALLVCEHVVLVGPPGTAKSMLLNALSKWMRGFFFSILLNEFTLPEELFGPISVKGLSNDEYRRVVANKMPTAHAVFLDEIFKANGAILNTTLQLLNEREYFDGSNNIQCPLKLCVAASNEWPTGDSGKKLLALFDRFLLRKNVSPVTSPKDLHQLVFNPPALKITGQLSESDLATAQAAVKHVTWSKAAIGAYMDILQECQKNRIQPGNRRVQKSRKLCEAAAWLSGSSVVSAEHMGILSHSLWTDPVDQPREVEAIVRTIAKPVSMRIEAIVREAKECFAAIDWKDETSAPKASKKLGQLISELNEIGSVDTKDLIAEIESLKKSIRNETLKRMGIE
jgi:MoxR-like ATPase